MSDQIPTVGRIVHYVAADHATHIAAMVLAVRRDSSNKYVVDLQLFPSPVETPWVAPGHIVTSVREGEPGPSALANTWHWPERLP